MNEHDRQALDERDIVDVVTTAQERGMVYLWPVVAEQIANPEAMHVHVMMGHIGSPPWSTGASISYRRQHHG
jgi:hypothetical protein